MMAPPFTYIFFLFDISFFCHFPRRHFSFAASFSLLTALIHFDITFLDISFLRHFVTTRCAPFRRSADAPLLLRV